MSALLACCRLPVQSPCRRGLRTRATSAGAVRRALEPEDALTLGLPAGGSSSLTETLRRFARSRPPALSDDPTARRRFMSHCAHTRLGTAGGFSCRIPGRPNGREGWVPASALGEMHVTTRVFARQQRAAARDALPRRARDLERASGHGTARRPHASRPLLRDREADRDRRTFYGPYAFGTSAYAPTLSEWPGGGIVGIHGTDEPQLIPGRPSHGCIRLRNADIERLWPLLQVGTPIEIV